MISAVVITKNEEMMITDCLTSLQFADEIIVVDTGNSDRTNILAKNFSARVIRSKHSDYSGFRNDGLKAVRGDFILYIDADERVSPELATEIVQVTKQNSPSIGAFALHRENIYLGNKMQYGGWGNEYLVRLFKTHQLKRWINPLHEQPEFIGGTQKLKYPIFHLSHRDLGSMIKKTIEFTAVEAKLRFDHHHPPIVTWRLFRVMASEFYLRFIKFMAWRDGPVGVIEGMFQVFNSFVIYAKLWEMQQTKPISHVQSPDY